MTSFPGGSYDATNILGLGQAACMQSGGPPYTPGSGQAYGREDCLLLNLYRPRANPGPNSVAACTPDQPCPILIWIFGGDNSASEIIPYNATQLAALHHAIVVTVSYRLGALGFAAFEEDVKAKKSTGNFGMHDVLAAAGWIQSNAKGLGGDPTRMIVFGESSGATDAQILSMVPSARGIVSGSISESGGLYAQSLEDAIKNTKEMAYSVGCDGVFEPIKQCLSKKDGGALVNSKGVCVCARACV